MSDTASTVNMGWVQSMNDTMDLVESRLDRVEGKQRTQQLVVMGVACAAIAEGFMLFTVIKTLKDVSQSVAGIINFINVAQQPQVQPDNTPQSQQASAGRPMKVEPRVMPSEAPVAPAAEGPVTEAPEWAAEANAVEAVGELTKEPFGEG